jgi:hypothetical protein
MTAHPRVMRMILWEHAGGWQTYVRVASIFELAGFDRFEAFTSKARSAGLLRSNLDLSVLFMLAEQICWTYPTSLPFYQLFMPGRDLSSPAALARARTQIVDFIVAGFMPDPKS